MVSQLSTYLLYRDTYKNFVKLTAYLHFITSYLFVEQEERSRRREIENCYGLPDFQKYCIVEVIHSTVFSKTIEVKKKKILGDNRFSQG